MKQKLKKEPQTKEQLIGELKKRLDSGKPVKTKSTRMRVPIVDGKEDWEHAEKLTGR